MRRTASINNFVFQTFNTITLVFNSIVVVPLYISYFSEDTYGAWLATGNLIALLGMIESGLTTVITRKLSISYSNRTDDLTHVLGLNFLFALVVALLILLLGVAFYPLLERFIDKTGIEWTSISIAYFIALFSAAISMLNSFIGVFAQAIQNTFQVGLYSVLANLGGILVLFLTLYNGLGVVSIAISYLVRALINLLCTSIWSYKQILLLSLFPIFPPRVLIKSTIRESSYLFMSKIMRVLLQNSQNLLIAIYIGNKMSALYEFNVKMPFILIVFSLSNINSAFFARFSQILASRNDSSYEYYLTFTSGFIAVLFVFGVTSFLFAQRFVTLWVGEENLIDFSVVSFLIAALLLFQFISYNMTVLRAADKIQAVSVIEIRAHIAQLVIMILGIQYIGLYALPMSIMVYNLIAGLYITQLLRQIFSHNPLQRSVVRTALILIICLVVSIMVGSYLHIPNIGNMLSSITFVLFCIFIVKRQLGSMRNVIFE